MTLGAINNVLRAVGVVLVVSVDDSGGPTRLWFERAKSYDQRTSTKG